MAACGLAADDTRVAALRRGVLEVVVGSGVLLQEMAHYHKRLLLEQLRGLFSPALRATLRK